MNLPPLYLSSLPPLQTLPQEALIVYFIGTPRVNRDGHQGGGRRGPRPMEHRKGGNYMGATRRTSNHAIIIHPFRQRRGRRVGKGQMRIARGPLFIRPRSGSYLHGRSSRDRPDPIRSAARIIGHDVKQIARPIAFPPYSCQRPISRENFVIRWYLSQIDDTTVLLDVSIVSVENTFACRETCRYRYNFN